MIKNSTRSKRFTESATAIRNKTLHPLFKRKDSVTTARDSLPIDQRWTSSSEKMSSLTVRILAVNIIAIMILGVGILYLGEYTDSLIEGEIDSLTDEAKFISAALSEGAVRPIFEISPSPFNEPMEIDAVKPSLARSMMARLGQSSKSHIRLYGIDGSLLADSNMLSLDQHFVQKEKLNTKNNFNIGYLFNQSASRFLDIIPTQTKLSKLPSEAIQDVSLLPDTRAALNGVIKSSAWEINKGNIILTAAAPIQKIKHVLAIVVLVREGNELENKITQIRVDVFRVFLASLGITVMLSIYLSGLIGKPLKRLALAAEAVRISKDRTIEIPDMSKRGDEIGELSLVIRDMTEALRDRMDTIERFAADVSHEIKNPLTSLRSAVETAKIIKDPEKQKKLMDIIYHDVQRLDRLISDISSASRLDAELSRDSQEVVNLTGLLYRLKDALKDPVQRLDSDHNTDDRIKISFPPEEKLYSFGNEERLGQVFANIISNAISFSPPSGHVHISAEKIGKSIVISIADEGPGIPHNKLDAIFERFYTERPHESYGGHSGLGLSISKQIIEAHDGKIWAENKTDFNKNTIGAIFKVELKAIA